MSATLVLLHGFTGAPASWDPVLELLPTRARVVAPVLLGHGGPDQAAGASEVGATDPPVGSSDSEPGPPDGVAGSFEGEVDRLAALATEAEPPRHLAGYSLGARLALGMLVRHPHLFARATLIGVNPGLIGAAERQERERSDRCWVELLEEQGLEAFLREWRSLPMWSSQRRASARLLEAQERINLGHDAAALALSLRVLGLAAMPDWTPHLGAIDAPVTLMTGELDTKFCILADEMALRMRAAHRLTLAAAGHNLLLERPKAVAHALQEE